jgi:hypothetical protein
MANKTAPEWPEDKVESLRQLAIDGYSAREIVDRLWLEGFKTTRNAVLGISNRRKIKVGLVSKAGYLQSKRFGRRGKTPDNDMPPRAPIPDRGYCQWPLGDAWCGCKTDGVYCPEHYAMSQSGKVGLTVKEIDYLSKLT